MDAGELFDAFRDDVVDTSHPYLWTDAEVWRYLDAAYRMFVRLTGGIADFTSVASEAQIIAGEPIGELHPSILIVNSAFRASDGEGIDIINYTDIARRSTNDYGRRITMKLDSTTGPVDFGVVGMQRNVIRWIKVPEVDDVANFTVHRLPLENLTSRSQKLDDVEQDHHLSLLYWMKHLAYAKQDSDTFDKSASDTCKAMFEGYCSIARAEAERYKHKPRTVMYRGL